MNSIVEKNIQSAPTMDPELENILFTSKSRVLKFIIIYSLFVVTVFMLLAYLNANTPIIYLNLISFIMLTLLYYYLKKTANISLSSHFVIFIIGIHYLYLVYNGGMQQMGFMWTFLFPLGVIFFVGKRKGLYYSFVFMVAASIILFTASIYKEQGISFQLRYIGIYLTFTIVAYAFESIRSKMNESIILKNQLLNSKIEELKEKDLALTVSKERAEKAEQLKSEFLAQMSHEIRTPINTILNYTSLLETDLKPKLPEELRHSFSSINNASSRLIRTIDLILDLSAVESGAHELIMERHDLTSDIIIPVVTEFEQAAGKKNISIRYNNPAGCDCFIIADKYTITQTLTNLVHNAIKYTDYGDVIISCSRDNGTIQLSIKDTGIGISEEYLPNLFTKFSQETQGYTRSYEGNGLGLALVKKYCDINYVDIMVDSKKDEGTEFKLIFKEC